MLYKIMAGAKYNRYYYHLQPSASPTYYNLSHYLQRQYWRATRFHWRAHFSEKNFQFDLSAAECLEFKNLLAQLVAEFCPQIMPLTYCIDDENWPLVLEKIASNSYQKRNPSSDKTKPIPWILKPALLNNGQHIKIFRDLDQLSQHYHSANRMGGAHVIQQYLQYPHLLKGPQQGHKYSIRMFVILTNYAGAYLYPKGYFNIALRPYQPDVLSDLRSHLTNEHLSDDVLNVVQIETQQYDLFKPFYPKIKTIVDATIHGLRKRYPCAFICDQQRNLAIFGFDFMVDDDMRVWLLEVNHGPCFPTNDEHPLQKNLYAEFWQAVIASFVLPIASHQSIESIQYPAFVAVGG